MINDFSTTLYNNIITLVDVVREPDQWEDQEQSQRIQMAALSILSGVGMAIASIWLLKIVASVITYPFRLALKLSIPIIMFVVLRDIFVLCRNAETEELLNNHNGLQGLFGGLRELEQDEVEKFTQEALLRNLWVWIYRKP